MKARALVMVLAMALALSPAAMAQEVVVGALNDMTGATSDVGKDYALGIAEAVNYCNDNGGVNGKPGQWGHAIGGMGAITQTMAKSCAAPV